MFVNIPKSFKSSTIIMIMMMIQSFLLNSSFAAVSSEDSALDYDKNDRELQVVRPLLGECQGNCGKKRKCAPGYACARDTYEELYLSFFNVQFAYCDTSRLTDKTDKYFCYDQLKMWKMSCRDITYPNDDGIKCDPNSTNFIAYGKCLMTPIDSSYCCKAFIEKYNRTHSICEEHRSCQSYVTAFCSNVGTTEPDYRISFTGPGPDRCARRRCV